MSATSPSVSAPLIRDQTGAPLLAASIFLEALNVFLVFLQIFSRND